MHSIHRDLIVKHNMLIDDLSQARDEKQRCFSEIQKLKQQLLDANNLNSNLHDEIKNKENLITVRTREVESLELRLRDYWTQIESKKGKEDQTLVQLNEKEREIQDLKLRVANHENHIRMLEQNVKDLKENVQEVKGEKSTQESKIHEQQEQIELQRNLTFEAEKKILIQNQEIERLNEKNDKLNGKILSLEQERDILIQHRKQLEVEVEFCKQRISILNQDIEALESVIKEMKVSRGELEDQYVKLKLKHQDALETLKSKSSIITQMEVH